jgi:hypothetical protein
MNRFAFLFLVVMVQANAWAQTPTPKPAVHPSTVPANPAPAKPATTSSAIGQVPVGGIMDLMSAMIIPASESLFTANDNPTKSDADWQTLERNALILAESGNLLMISGRAKDRGEWMKLSRNLVNAATAAYKAAKSKDLAKLGDIGDDQIYPICDSCHKAYIKR